MYFVVTIKDRSDPVFCIEGNLMRKYDVAYILKQNVKPDELRYSLRSIEENLNHGKVFFYCGKPDGIEPDVYVQHVQTGVTKWERARSSLIKICENKDMTKKFWLFNDDFYILAPMTSEKPLHRGLIKDHYLDVEKRHGGMITAYTRQLRNCEDMLKSAGCTTLDYALHVPMLIDRAKMLEALQMFPRCPMFRSLYGNYASIGGEFIKDNKIMTPGRILDPDARFLSSSDKTFNESVREFLEERFPDPCRYEHE